MLLQDQPLDSEEIAAVLTTTERFCKQSVRPLSENPEHTASADQMREVTEAAREAGILGQPDDIGLSIWCSPLDTARFSLSLEMLKLIAGENAGVAFHLHNLALGAYLAAASRIDGLSHPVACLQGESGTGKGALAKLLSGRVLDGEEKALVEAAFPQTGASIWLQAADPWESVITPSLDAAGVISWFASVRDGARADLSPHCHGLNEAPVWGYEVPTSGVQRSPLEKHGARALYITALGLQAAGLTAIAVGGLTGAVRKAKAYALERRQGGKLIARHHAVQFLLAEGAASSEMLSASLRGLAPALSLDGLDRILSMRSVTHPLCCVGVNAAMQVFGGYGYMRDYGMEKRVRDQNQLRLTGMPPAELSLYLAERMLLT